jgi:putative Ca2+/H+ antiporter (TMEM165/GDT1 family)
MGTVLGHLTCTFAAVMGGRWLATKISVKHVTLGGAVLFLIFGIAYLFEVRDAFLFCFIPLVA